MSTFVVVMRTVLSAAEQQDNRTIRTVLRLNACTVHGCVLAESLLRLSSCTINQRMLNEEVVLGKVCRACSLINKSLAALAAWRR
jgi:hypothetical protein